MDEHTDMTTDGPDEPHLPAWARATEQARRLQRIQLVLLLVAGAAIVAIIVAGGLTAFHARQDQKAREERGTEIRALRADFGSDLVRFQVRREGSARSSIDTASLARFAGFAVRIVALASSYEPERDDERQARDAVIALNDEFTALQSDATALRRALAGEAGVELAISAIERVDAWAEENSRTLREARTSVDLLLARFAATVIALVLLMSAVFVVLWIRIERSRRRALSEAYRQARRFDSLVRNASDMVMVVDEDGVISYCSESAPRMLGWTAEELTRMPLRDLVHADDRRLLATISDDDGDGRGQDVISLRFARSDGGWLDVETLASNLLADPAVSGIVLNSRDVTDRRAAEEKLEHLAMHDPLTGLANRTLFEDRLAAALARRAETSGGLAVLILDLDDFKTVNDGLGHHAGDELLQIVGQRLLTCLRPEDTAARLGGDEYGVLLETAPGPRPARSVADRVYEAVRSPVEIGGEQVVVSASIGIALAPTHGDAPERLMRSADLAMYAAKGSSGRRIAAFTAEMEQVLDERIRLRTDLAAAIGSGDQLALEYQPIVQLRTGTTVGFEALLRWDHPELGRVMPDRFIPLAEETGLIIPIGEYVLRTACRQAAGWSMAMEDRVTMSVNLSARQLDDPALAATISSALAESGLPPDHLTLEVTESVLMQNLGHAVATLERVKALGVRVAVDDFGTGYSSLSQIGRLPVDIVKIDRVFVERLSSGTADADLAGIIVQLGAVLGLEAVAEGIETPEQRDGLRRLGCRLGQGYYFARPMPADEVSALIEGSDGAVTADDRRAGRRRGGPTPAH